MTKRKSKNTLVFILLGVIAILIIVAVVKSKSKSKGEKVSVEKVEKRTIKEKVSASGKIFPETEVKISSDVSGEIVELFIEEGDSVSIGQLLAKIDPDQAVQLIMADRASENSWSGTDWVAMLYRNNMKLVQHPDIKAFYIGEGKWVDYLAQRIPGYLD